MKRFNYDVIKLIEGVRDRPCLWNKNIENYKDRVERKLAWIEIFNILDERYDEMSSDDKRLTSEMVLSKWTNMRDTFVKSLKNKVGKPKKQYVLHDHLKFLMPVIPEADRPEQDNLGYCEDQTFMKDEVEEESTSFYTKPKAATSDYFSKINNYQTYEDSGASLSEPEEQRDDRVPGPVFKESSKRKRRKDSRKDEDESDMDFVAVDDPRIMNEDEAFFASLLPTIVKYDEDERLQFRIEVLELMKKIKDKRKWSSGPS